ncbi:carbohydrate ABC transporter permease [Atribacter laminatus]|uniref:L-arabinose transport system permease protein AraP n=1 Tax=Atribacter laminatus TaxID=2847778 RepID=A0A7T1AM67_ATRLM|nr:sugar ABC transporter permease [Atribacter laminatus]QPM68487.1 L-arabinose transport system permease protein AraP [Atribacter laminatus]
MDLFHRRKRRKSLKTTLHQIVFFLPALILMIIFLLYPVLNTLWTSFTSEDHQFVFLDNYKKVLSSKDVFNQKGFTQGFPLGALPHNFLWILIHLPLTTFLGLVLAVLFKDLKYNYIFKSSIFLGMVTPMVIGGVILRFIYEKEVGIINAILELLGFQAFTWTAYPETALLSLIFGSVWLWTGFSMIIYSSGLGNIPKEYYEAAALDGATPFVIFFRITIPLLKQMTVVVITMTILWELKIFDLVYVATMGGPGGASNVMALQMYFYAFRQFNFQNASVIATLLMLLTLFVTIPLIKSSLGEER